MYLIKLIIMSVASVLASTSRTFIDKERSLAVCNSLSAGDTCSWSYECESACCSQFVDTSGNSVSTGTTSSRCAKTATNGSCENSSSCPEMTLADSFLPYDNLGLILGLIGGVCGLYLCCVCCSICCPCCCCCGKKNRTRLEN